MFQILFLILIALPSFASMTIFPTAAHFDLKKSVAVVSIKNSSDTITTYKIEPVYYVPDATGKLSMSAKPSEEEKSLVRYLRFSPKSVTLNPYEEQVVRIMVKKDRRLPPGDYRAHVRFSPEAENNNLVELKKKPGMYLDAKVAVSIPVLLRIEPIHKKLTIENFKIYKAGDSYRFTAKINKGEHYFPYGEFRIKGITKNGKKFELGLVKGIQSFKETSSYDYPLSNSTQIKDALKATIQFIETFNSGEEPIADASTFL